MNRRIPSIIPVAILLLTFLLSADTGTAAPSRRARLDRVVAAAVEKNTAEPVRVIVRTKDGKRAAVRNALRNRGKTIGADFGSIGSFGAEMTARDIAVLAADESVESISLDAPLSAQGEFDDDDPVGYTRLMQETLGLDRANVNGWNVGIAVIDSGIRRIYDVALGGAWEFNGAPARAILATDEFGHGSHVASLIGATGSRTGYDYIGVAPSVRLYALKVLDRNGQGKTSDVISAIEFATSNRVNLGIDIINLSLGHAIHEPAESDPLVQAVESAVRAGIVVVVSAGNCGTISCSGDPSSPIGYAGITSPGNAPSAITVGAYSTNYTVTRNDDRVTRYSSRGPTWQDGFAKPDIVAPGHGMIANGDVKSQLYKYQELRLKKSRRTLRLSGTSMAAAMTTGVVALMIEANRRANTTYWGWTPFYTTLTPNAIKAMLQFTAIPLRDDTGYEYDELTQGAGGLNGGGAVALARSVNNSALPGAPWLLASVNPYTTIASESYTWGQKIVWGYNIVSGNVMNLNESAWAKSLAWGDGSVWNVTANRRNIVWGSNVVWDLNIPWAQNIVWGNDLIGSLQDQKIVWGYVTNAENVVWGNLSDSPYSGGSNIVWGFADWE